MQVAIVGSGSKGNATLIRSQSTTLLVDCGFTVKETCARLAKLGVSGQQIDAVLVTHEHGDHIKGVGALARRFDLPVFMTSGSYRADKLGEVTKLELINAYQEFQVGDIQVQPYPVPHDAQEPSQFVFNDGAYKAGLLTDAGMITPHMVEVLQDCDGLILEFNHDWQMLQSGRYPWKLKQRVGSNYGHLNNLQSIELLHQVKHPGFKHLIAAHISEENNCKTLVTDLLQSALANETAQFQLARQDNHSDWFTLANSN